MEISIEELLQKAENYAREGVDWHHHYLPPGCSLNGSARHITILEANGSSWRSLSDDKPLKYLEKLENLFFQRT